MSFAEAMVALASGASVRRQDWGPRRAIRLMLEPWNGERERVLFFDLKGEVVPFPFSMTGADVRGTDWEIIENA